MTAPPVPSLLRETGATRTRVWGGRGGAVRPAPLAGYSTSISSTIPASACGGP